MAILENISDEDLKEVTGGTIVQIDKSQGSYYVLVDENRKGRYIRTCPTLEAAQYFASQSGLSQEIISKETFKERFHYDLNA